MRKLCNNFKKPTGKPCELRDCIFCCISIECRIQFAAIVAILGVSSAESSHSADDDRSILPKIIDEDNTAVVAGGGMGHCEERSAGNGGSIQFSVGGNDDEERNGDNEDDEEVVRANDAGTNAVDNEAMFLPRPATLPSFVGGSSMANGTSRVSTPAVLRGTDVSSSVSRRKLAGGSKITETQY